MNPPAVANMNMELLLIVFMISIAVIIWALLGFWGTKTKTDAIKSITKELPNLSDLDKEVIKGYFNDKQ